MEEQVQQKILKMVQRSDIYNYKLSIPIELERKIRFICQKVWDTEWSGILFFTYQGSFENNDLVIICKDIYVMNIGTQAYTEFDMNPDVIAYMTEHQELLDCQIGLVHSHNNMPSFFSGTDVNTLREEGTDRNNFVSLIVNNAGTYTAAITRKVTSCIKESLSFKFFNNEERTENREYQKDEEVIEWYYLRIEKEGCNDSFHDVDARLNELKEQEKLKTISTTHTVWRDYSKLSSYPELNITVKEGSQEPLHGYYNEKDSKRSYSSLMEQDCAIPYEEISADSIVIKSLVRQLLTCSIIIPNESRVDINKWAENMPRLYEARFNSNGIDIKDFHDWAEYYTEFLTWRNDKDLMKMGFDRTDVQAIYAYYLIKELAKLPKNKYIDIYIENLKKLLI